MHPLLFSVQHFTQHKDEEDDERALEIIERGKNDLRWLKAKVQLRFQSPPRGLSVTDLS
jgi:hypothetical protein